MIIDEASSFKEHIEYLSTHLRSKYDMVLEETPEGNVGLRNDVVVIKFHEGNDREPYVGLSISYLDSSILGQEKWFLLEDYVSYLGAREAFFPVSSLEENRQPYYYNIGSPFQILEIVIFLTLHSELLLKGNCEKVQAFMEWMFERNRKYSEKMSKKKTS